MGFQRKTSKEAGAKAEILFQRHSGHYYTVANETATKQL